MASVLIVEDDRALSTLLRMHLEDHGHSVQCCDSAQTALLHLRERSPELVLLDYQLPDGDGLGVLEQIKATAPQLPVIMITGVSDTAVTIAAIQRGAYDFIRKPMDQAELDATMANALEAARLARQLETAVEQTPAVSINSIVGESRAVLEVCKTIGRVAATDATVLITGESGTGKEVVARAIHHHSGRHGLFVPINCSAIVDNLLESELFGHEKGSFTGAVARKDGKFTVANDGTLFLDEIGELAPPLQAKLLRVLQERQYERLGGNQVLTTTARVVAATNRDLAAMVREGAFREDLYYRLNVVSLHLPPLRERPEDLSSLVEHLLHKVNRTLHKRVRQITPAAWRKLEAYHWPGNIRELENVITRAVVLANQGVITPELLGIPDDGGSAVGQQREHLTDGQAELVSLETVEARHVAKVLSHTGWHKGRACEILGISRPALERKIQKYGLVRPAPGAAR